MSPRANLLILSEIGSSNQYALDHFQELADRSLIVAARQSAGRGRQGRSWHSPEGGLYASWLVKDFALPPYCASWLGVLAALELVRECAPGLDCGIKWPNDLLCRGKKLCGVLCEGKASVQGHGGMVIGIGLNVNISEVELAKAGKPATSLLTETGRLNDLKLLAAKLADKLSTLYEEALTHGQNSLYERWKRENIFLGEKISMRLADGSLYNGVAEDINPDGALILRLENGDTKAFHSGEQADCP